jgi:hypothetical protein
MVGYILSDIDNSQKCKSLFRDINKQTSVFYQSLHKTNFQIELPIFNVCYAFNGFKEPLISTCINTTRILKECLDPVRKLFYIYDIEWNFIHQEASDFEDIYLNDDIDLIASSTDDYDLIKSCWKEPVGIMKDFNYDDIRRILG